MRTPFPDFDPRYKGRLMAVALMIGVVVSTIVIGFTLNLMNTGLQDAYNLAWKLAGVINKQIKQTILDSYADERMPVAKTLLKTTDRIFTVIMSNRWYTINQTGFSVVIQFC